MHMQVAGFLLGVQHLGGAAIPFDQARIAGLAAALGVVGRGVEEKLYGITGRRAVRLRAIVPDGQQFTIGKGAVIALEGRRTEPVPHSQPAGTLGGLA